MKLSLSLTTALLAFAVTERSFADTRLSCDAICDTGTYSAYCFIKVETESELKLINQIAQTGGFDLRSKVLLAGTTPSPELCSAQVYQSGEFIDSKSVPVIGPVSGEVSNTRGSYGLGGTFVIGVKYLPTSPQPRILDPIFKTKL